MGVTAMLPGMTFRQLHDEATGRWGDIWESDITRMQIMIICKRKERKLLELHGDMIEHGQPVMGIFHRPRTEAYLIEEQGLNPKDASFQFLDIASSDMGPWLQYLVNNEGWKRRTIEIFPTPISLGIPNQRSFEPHSILCFQHPDLEVIERYYMPFPIDALSGKAFVSLPNKKAAELAKQQAEILGVGKATNPQAPVVENPTESEQVSVVPPSPAMTTESIEFTTEVESKETETIEYIEEPVISIPLPASEVPTPNEQIEQHVSFEQHLRPSSSEGDDEIEPKENSGLESEIRALISTMLEEGIEPSNMMEDGRFDILNERALAVNLEVWPIFLEMVSI